MYQIKQEYTLQTDYVDLDYEVAHIPYYYHQNYENNKTVYVKLRVDNNNIAHFDGISDTQPKSLFLKGKTYKYRVKFGIESYFVKEGSGRILEHNLRNGALAKVIIDKNGQAKVKDFIKK